MPPPPHLTTAQLKVAAERRAAKLAKRAQQATGSDVENEKGRLESAKRSFMKREWSFVAPESASDGRARSVRLVTWNVLAQTLVTHPSGRELFPGSDCLKWGDRGPMLQAELAHYGSADVICLQECDRLRDLAPSLPHHSYIEAKGRNKLHGLVIFYRESHFSVRAHRTIYLDEEFLSIRMDPQGVHTTTSGRKSRGGSRQTKNIGLIVALTNIAGWGIIVLTTHLFWHPKFTYERLRQVLILVRAAREFRNEAGLHDWPIVMAGDLNTQPSEVTYQLLVEPNQDISTAQMEDLEASRLVHGSVDTTSADLLRGGAEGLDDREDGKEDGGQDGESHDQNQPQSDTDEKSTANTRRPTPEDGILDAVQMVALSRDSFNPGCRSAYGSSRWTGETYAERLTSHVDQLAAGGLEPGYTCFTPLFRLTLDYILLLPCSIRPEVRQVLNLAAAEQLGEGLPRKGISASDHLAIGCEFAW